jgi:hypothetical protein
MQPAKILSSSIQKNRSGIEIQTVIAELRRNQLVTAEWINMMGESAGPLRGDWVVIVPRAQSFGGHLAFGFVDIINSIFAAGGVKIIYGRNSEGKVKTKVTLTDSEVIIENPLNARIELAGQDIVLNSGNGTALEKKRLQTALDAFSVLLVTEFAKVAAGTLPTPVNPYIPSPILPNDISAAESPTIKVP